MPESASNVIKCGLGQGATQHRVCRVPIDELGNCTIDKEFGYPEGKPCVLIKLNKVIFNTVDRQKIHLEEAKTI